MDEKKVEECMETIRALADVAETGQVSVQVYASLFYDILRVLEHLTDNSIVVISDAGDVIAEFSHEEGRMIREAAVHEFIIQAVKKAAT